MIYVLTPSSIEVIYIGQSQHPMSVTVYVGICIPSQAGEKKHLSQRISNSQPAKHSVHKIRRPYHPFLKKSFL